MHGGRERSVAATKTFTGQMMLFYMLRRSSPTARPPGLTKTIPKLAARALEQTAGNTRTRAALCLHWKIAS